MEDENFSSMCRFVRVREEDEEGEERRRRKEKKKGEERRRRKEKKKGAELKKERATYLRHLHQLRTSRDSSHLKGC